MSKAMTTAVLVGLAIAAVLVAWYVLPGWNWILVMALMAAFLAVLGFAITGRVLGVLINEHKIMSLSRFQIALWTVIIVSGYFVIALARVKQGDVADPLAVEISWQLWALLGISATSLVASPIAASAKTKKTPDSKVLETAGKPYHEDDTKEVEKNRLGVMYPNKDVSEARFTDMFEGEELSNSSLVDMSKVQLFFFTVVIAAAYCFELHHAIVTDDLAADGYALPTIHEGLLALVGISHAGYIGSKSITQTPTKV